MQKEFKKITREEMQLIDKKAQEEFFIPEIILMENAGFKSAMVALRMVLGIENPKIVCVCGKGNNGGDGLVCARHLINKKIEVKIFLTDNPLEFKNSAALNYKILKKMKAKIFFLKQSLKIFKKSLEETNLIVDAIFGIGLKGKVDAFYQKIISLINKAQKPVLSLDIPSGLDANEGFKLGACVKATKTITFGLPKTGLFKNEGSFYAGDVLVTDISLPWQLLK